jgi:hypothetical protein
MLGRSLSYLEGSREIKSFQVEMEVEETCVGFNSNFELMKLQRRL